MIIGERDAWRARPKASRERRALHCSGEKRSSDAAMAVFLWGGRLALPKEGGLDLGHYKCHVLITLQNSLLITSTLPPHLGNRWISHFDEQISTRPASSDLISALYYGTMGSWLRKGHSVYSSPFEKTKLIVPTCTDVPIPEPRARLQLPLHAALAIPPPPPLLFRLIIMRLHCTTTSNIGPKAGVRLRLCD